MSIDTFFRYEVAMDLLGDYLAQQLEIQFDPQSDEETVLKAEMLYEQFWQMQEDLDPDDSQGIEAIIAKYAPAPRLPPLDLKGDTWSQEDSINFECAREVVTDLNSILRMVQAQEEEKPQKDILLIQNIERILSYTWKRRKGLLATHRQEVAAILSEYGKFVREFRFGNKDEKTIREMISTLLPPNDTAIQQALAEGIASAKLEGYEPTTAFMQDCDAIARGQLTTEQALANSLARAREIEKQNKA